MEIGKHVEEAPWQSLCHNVCDKVDDFDDPKDAPSILDAVIKRLSAELDRWLPPSPKDGEWKWLEYQEFLGELVRCIFFVIARLIALGVPKQEVRKLALPAMDALGEIAGKSIQIWGEWISRPYKYKRWGIRRVMPRVAIFLFTVLDNRQRSQLKPLIFDAVGLWLSRGWQDAKTSYDRQNDVINIDFGDMDLIERWFHDEEPARITLRGENIQRFVQAYAQPY